MVTDHIELASATLCTAATYLLYQMYSEGISLFLPTSCIYLFLENHKRVKSNIFFTFFITSTGKSAIIFFNWNLNKHSGDCLWKCIALEQCFPSTAWFTEPLAMILDFNHHCCKQSKVYFLYSILSFTSKMWKPPIILLVFPNNLGDFIKYVLITVQNIWLISKSLLRSNQKSK